MMVQNPQMSHDIAICFLQDNIKQPKMLYKEFKLNLKVKFTGLQSYCPVCNRASDCFKFRQQPPWPWLRGGDKLKGKEKLMRRKKRKGKKRRDL